MRHLLTRIVFICNPVFTYGKPGWSPHDTFLAGTEDSIREWAWRIKACQTWYWFKSCTVAFKKSALVSFVFYLFFWAGTWATRYEPFTTFITLGITAYRDWETDRKSTRLNSSHRSLSRMPSSA